MSERWDGKTRHGTQSGWSKHKNEGSDPCNACYTAKQEYDQRRRDIPEITLRSRLRARAQNRALSALARRYPEDYHALYEQIADAVFAEEGLARQPRRKRLTTTPTEEPPC